MTSIENTMFFDEEALLDRLSEGVRGTTQEVVFVVGAPLTASDQVGVPGVSNVREMISEIRKIFPEGNQARIALEGAISNAPNQYQAAFQFLQGRRGQNVCNRIVREAVLRARQLTGKKESSKWDVSQLNDEQLAQLDREDEGWHLSKGVEALAKIIVEYPRAFGRTVLTSNFDPLIEVAIRNSGGDVWQTSLVSDADLNQNRAKGCRIVHFHGYWHGTDTLHTGAQLLQSRPTLKTSLLEYLKDKLVVVVAYGGWEDIFTSALKDLTGNTAVFPEVLWSFYDDTPVLPSHLQSVLRPGIDRGRVSLYSGIDCHSFFEKLLQRWRHLSEPVSTEVLGEKKYSEPRRISIRTLKNLECDRPPNFDAWVGREAELRSLESTRSPVIIVTGIGGQGKSLTAAKHIRDTISTSTRYQFWDWRDCKEAADSIRTQVISAIDRITSEEINSEMLVSANDADLADLLVEHSVDARTIFVFDNVDHYVDLENFRFVGLLNRLVNGFAKSDSSSQLILTCRPEVRYDDSSIVTIPMPGLSLDEATELFKQRQVPSEDAKQRDIEAAHQMTRGHPFWLDLIASQVAQVPGVTLRSLLEDLRRGREESPNVLSSIWTRLAEREQTLLRVMAEAVRPETRETLEKYVSSKLRYNKFDKALRSLIRLNLVVVKPEVNSPDLYDLHPLVRQFVRQSFSPAERKDYIILVIGQYERFIKSLEKVLGFSLPLPLLGRWTQKAELEISAQRYQNAIQSLTEANDALIGGGHSEEFIRVARSLLEAVDWSSAPSELTGFDKIVSQFVECLDDLGEYDDADVILDRFQETISEKTARYIHFCDMKCYSFWKRGDFSTAIEWGEIGLKLKKQTNVDTEHGSEHNVALARRDAGDIIKAMDYFLGDTKLEDLVDPMSQVDIENGPKLGNVGRCLQLEGETKNALVCFKKSIRALENTSDANRLSNRAYARQWISECLFDQGDFTLAFSFAIGAEEILSKVSPSRVKNIFDIKEKILLRLDESEADLSVSEANRRIQRWIASDS